jgi:hypothetical protein
MSPVDGRTTRQLTSEEGADRFAWLQGIVSDTPIQTLNCRNNRAGEAEWFLHRGF